MQAGSGTTKDLHEIGECYMCPMNEAAPDIEAPDSEAQSARPDPARGFLWIPAFLAVPWAFLAVDLWAGYSGGELGDYSPVTHGFIRGTCTVMGSAALFLGGITYAVHRSRELDEDARTSWFGALSQTYAAVFLIVFGWALPTKGDLPDVVLPAALGLMTLLSLDKMIMGTYLAASHARTRR